MIKLAAPTIHDPGSRASRELFTRPRTLRRRRAAVRVGSGGRSDQVLMGDVMGYDQHNPWPDAGTDADLPAADDHADAYTPPLPVSAMVWNPVQVSAKPPDGGPTEAFVSFKVKNTSQRDLGEGELSAVIRAVALSGQAQGEVMMHVPLHAMPADGTEQVYQYIQLDPGDWAVSVNFDAAGITDRPPTTPVQVTVAGHIATSPENAPSIDAVVDAQLTVEITAVEHVGRGNVYRVHYQVTNHGRQALAAGAMVEGALGAELLAGGAADVQWYHQDYRYTEGLPPGSPQARYLTFEGPSPGQAVSLHARVAVEAVADSVRARLDGQGDVTLMAR